KDDCQVVGYIQQAGCGIVAEAIGAGMAASHLLPQREGGSEATGYPPAYSSRVQSAGFAITSDLASVVGSPITSHLATVLWWLSGLASSFTSRVAITNDLPNVFCWVSQMASSRISSFISNVSEVRLIVAKVR